MIPRDARSSDHQYQPGCVGGPGRISGGGGGCSSSGLWIISPNGRSSAIGSNHSQGTITYLCLSPCVPPRTHQTNRAPVFVESPVVPVVNRATHAWVGRKATRTSVVVDQAKLQKYTANTVITLASTQSLEQAATGCKSSVGA